MDCEAVGGDHEWYNVNGKESGCYHCGTTREGQLWRQQTEEAGPAILGYP
jgi:hypothetical protein